MFGSSPPLIRKKAKKRGRFRGRGRQENKGGLGGVAIFLHRCGGVAVKDMMVSNED